MSILQRGRLRARHAENRADLAAALALRAQCFRGGQGDDRDAFDGACKHVLVEDTGSGTLVCCYRVLNLAAGNIADSYSAQHYDLTALGAFPGRMAELGRFCVARGACDPDILRVAWGALTGLVERAGVGLLFGCSSFQGTDARPYRDAFAMLAARHPAPARWTPRIRAPCVVPFVAGRPTDPRRALSAIPPLLRTYLSMGGWVGDHAVIDRDLDTLHVFTGLEIAKVPAARARLLRAVAAQPPVARA